MKTDTAKRFKIGYKLFFALLGFSALVTEIVALVERDRFNLINFLSFFTVQTNILVVIVLLLGAIYLAANKSKKLDMLRGATVVYILIVGVGFSFLLSGLENVALTAVPWDNTVLHYIIPATLLVDYIIDRPQTKLSFKKALLWLIYPAVYVVYSLTRGALVSWYPYPFLNPNVTSIAQLSITILCLFALGLVFIALATKFSGKTLLK